MAYQEVHQLCQPVFLFDPCEQIDSMLILLRNGINVAQTVQLHMGDSGLCFCARAVWPSKGYEDNALRTMAEVSSAVISDTGSAHVKTLAWSEGPGKYQYRRITPSMSPKYRQDLRPCDRRGHSEQTPIELGQDECRRRYLYDSGTSIF